MNVSDHFRARESLIVKCSPDCAQQFPMRQYMGRSHGYRATEANRERVTELRAVLNGLRLSQWVKARYVMQQITEELGHRGGPSGSSIEPRACRYCDYFGHTRQHCPTRLEDVRRKEAEEAEHDANWRENLHARWREGNPEWAQWNDWNEWANAMYRSACETGQQRGEAWEQHKKRWAETEPPKPWVGHKVFDSFDVAPAAAHSEP